MQEGRALEGEALYPSVGVDHPELADDYQLARGIDLLRGISLYKSQHVPEGAPDLVKAAEGKDTPKADDSKAKE